MKLRSACRSALVLGWAALLLSSPSRAQPSSASQPALKDSSAELDAATDATEDLGRGASDRVEPAVATAPETAVLDDEEGADPQLILGVALAGFGVIGVATGAALYCIYLEETRELQSLAEQTNGEVLTGISQGEYMERYDRVQALMYASYGTFGVGAISTGVGVVFLLVSLLQDDEG